jgi:putative heme iron utilization protein
MPRFLARHPSAQAYAAFADFAMYGLQILRGHYIGGFGKIVDLAPADLCCDVAGAQELLDAEPAILEHMNTEHSNAVALYAAELGGCGTGTWRLSGIDPNGIDLLHRNKACRIDFREPVNTPQEARVALVAFAKEARARQQGLQR